MILHKEIHRDWMGLIVCSYFKLQNYEFKTNSYCISEPYYHLNPNSKITLSETHLKIIRNAEELIKNAKRFQFHSENPQEMSTEKEEDLCSYLPTSDLALSQKPIKLRSTQEMDLESLFATQINNKKKIITKLLVKNIEYIIPPKCSFMISDFNLLKDYLIKLDMKFDLIVMDPPWENKSVKRSGKYKSLDHYELFKIPINRILSQRGYFCIWVTNSAKLQNFVLNRYAKDLGLILNSTISWVKITTKGDFVIPKHSNHRKTYEICYVFRKSSHSLDLKDIYSDPSTQYSFDASSLLIPREICLVSVPSKEHSRKPNLQGIID